MRGNIDRVYGLFQAVRTKDTSLSTFDLSLVTKLVTEINILCESLISVSKDFTVKRSNEVNEWGNKKVEKKLVTRLQAMTFYYQVSFVGLNLKGDFNIEQNLKYPRHINSTF